MVAHNLFGNCRDFYPSSYICFSNLLWKLTFHIIDTIRPLEVIPKELTAILNVVNGEDAP